MIGTRAVTLSRPGVQTNVGGAPSYAASTTSTIYGSVQPVTGADLQKLPEGDRSRVALKFYSLSEVRTALPGSYTSDRLIIDGTTYLVYQVQDWPRVGSIPRHWRALLVRMQESEG